ncbi:hypothetical protein SAMN04515617_1366 [Collimonas sp. OK242]|jgi:hypothetical protein|nr:hypothetical protein SAMN04515617_1366 [Collimonas sp. OK242]
MAKAYVRDEGGAAGCAKMGYVGLGWRIQLVDATRIIRSFMNNEVSAIRIGQRGPAQ